LFYKAQEIRNSRIQHTSQVGLKRSDKGINYGTTPYAEKIKCASCGKQYRAFQTKQYGDRKERYYSCVGKLENYLHDKKCTNPNVSETFLNNELSNENYTMLLADSFVAAQKFLVELRTDLLSAINDESANKKLARLETDYAEYKTKISVAIDLLLDGGAVEESAKEKLDVLNAEASSIKAKIDELAKPKELRLYDLQNIDETMSELARRLIEIYDEVVVNESGVHFVDFNMPYEVVPKKHFTMNEILRDVDRIEVTGNKTLNVKFKTFTEIEQLVEKYKNVMEDRTKAIFEDVKVSGWDSVNNYTKSNWLRETWLRENADDYE